MQYRNVSATVHIRISISEDDIQDLMENGSSESEATQELAAKEIVDFASGNVKLRDYEILSDV